jgi:hypothetical protein
MNWEKIIKVWESKIVKEMIFFHWVSGKRFSVLFSNWSKSICFLNPLGQFMRHWKKNCRYSFYFVFLENSFFFYKSINSSKELHDSFIQSKIFMPFQKVLIKKPSDHRTTTSFGSCFDA